MSLCEWHMAARRVGTEPVPCVRVPSTSPLCRAIDYIYYKALCISICSLLSMCYVLHPSTGNSKSKYVCENDNSY